MPQLERTPAPRAARWLPRPAGFESHAPRALLSGDDSRFIRNGHSASLVDFLFANAPPSAPVTFQQIGSFDWTPRACCIVRETASGSSWPDGQDGLTHI